MLPRRGREDAMHQVGLLFQKSSQGFERPLCVFVDRDQGGIQHPLQPHDRLEDVPERLFAQAPVCRQLWPQSLERHSIHMVAGVEEVIIGDTLVPRDLLVRAAMQDRAARVA